MRERTAIEHWRAKYDASERELLDLRRYREDSEALTGALLDCFEKIEGHFRGGKLKGEGQWRISEIASALKEAETAIGEYLNRRANTKHVEGESQ